jgi:hypothetical protein
LVPDTAGVTLPKEGGVKRMNKIISFFEHGEGQGVSLMPRCAVNDYFGTFILYEHLSSVCGGFGNYDNNRDGKTPACVGNCYTGVST